MDSTSQSDSDGGGRRRHDALRDEGRPQTSDAPPDPGLTVGPPPPPPHVRAVLSLDQIRTTWNSNEYTEGPTVAQRSPASEHRQQKSDSAPSPGPKTSRRPETLEETPSIRTNLPSLTQHGHTSSTIAVWEAVLQSPSFDDSQSCIRTGAWSASSSTQRLLGSSAGCQHAIRTQPECSELGSEELKPLHSDSRVLAVAPAMGSSKRERIHSKCEDCGRCRCPECSRPQALPSCWMCGRRCVCSARSAVEYGTCACCVTGLFYHCSSDDEDTCADKPFSCAPPRCCVRWTAVSLLSLLLPCLLCYLPAKGCVSVCQRCYDRVTRPGCRC